jgi:hypothetical protein
MARILITTDTEGTQILNGHGVGVYAIAEVVTLSEIDGIYTIACSGDGDQCPADLEPGDTWSDFEVCVRDAVRHIVNHEARS